jgi:hypothetical protein
MLTAAANRSSRGADLSGAHTDAQGLTPRCTCQLPPGRVEGFAAVAGDCPTHGWEDDGFPECEGCNAKMDQSDLRDGLCSECHIETFGY